MNSLHGFNPSCNACWINYTTTTLADSELGAAVLAAFGSGLFNSWDRYYTLLARKEPAEEIRDPDLPDR